MELDRKRGGERGKKNPPFPFYPRTTFHLVEPAPFSYRILISRVNNTRRVPAASTRFFDGGGCFPPPSLPYLLAGHPLCPHGGRGGRRRRQKCIFRERFAVIGSHHVRGKCSLFKRYSAPNRLQFSHRWHNRWRRRRGRNVASVSPNIVSTSFRD